MLSEIKLCGKVAAQHKNWVTLFYFESLLPTPLFQRFCHHEIYEWKYFKDNNDGGNDDNNDEQLKDDDDDEDGGGGGCVGVGGGAF